MAERGKDPLWYGFSKSRDAMRTLLVLLILAAAAACGMPAEESVPEEQTGMPVTDAPDRPAWVDDAVIYELFVRNFTPEGTFQAAAARLPELRALGVTTVWLMPIHPVGEARAKGTLGSPYAVRDYFGVNPRFGTPDDFRAFVEAAHAEGLKVIIDFVANHTAWDNAWVEAHPDWYVKDADGAITHPAGTDWTDVADLDYDHPEVRAEMQRAMVYWVETFGIDGYRCDVAEMVPADFWAEAIDAVRAVKPVLMLAEGEDPMLHRVGFDVTYAWRLYGALKEVWNGAPATAFVDVVREQQEAFSPEALRLRFTTNHDETAWDAPPVILFDGPRGAQAAAVLMTLLPGVPLVYNGQEVGSDVRTPLFEEEPLAWTGGEAMRTFYGDLLALHNEHRALRRGAMPFIQASDDVVIYERASGEERFLVVVNVRDRAVEIDVPAPYTAATLTDVWDGAAFEGGTFALQPYAYRVLRIA